MFKLVKVLLFLVGLAGFVFIGFFVRFGEMTLYQHLVGIGRTDEARALGGEIEKKAEAVAREVKGQVPSLIPGGKSPPPAADAGPLGDITRKDRQALEALLRAKKADR
jgi:hypothetical protein